MIEILILLILAIVEIWISHSIALNKEQYGLCLILGLIFGPIGWLISALMPNKIKKNIVIKSNFIPCPHCGKGLRKTSIRLKGNICQWCGSQFDATI